MTTTPIPGSMLTFAELATLERSLRNTRVLTVYVDAPAADPAHQRGWRVELEHALAVIRDGLADASAEERHQVDACVRLHEAAFAAAEARSGAHGWVAFVTPTSVAYAGVVLAPVPTMATWGMSATVGPYLRALKQSRRVVVAVMDARKASIYRYQAGRLEPVTTLHAHHELAAPSHMGDAPRVGFHPGTRGVAARDEMQRAHRAGMRRMLAMLADRVLDEAGDDGWILLGGIPRVIAHAARELEPAKRRVLRTVLDVHSTEAEIAHAARAGASALRDASDARAIDDVVTQADSGRLGVFGREATERALELTSVRTLYLSERFLAEHPARAAEAVRRAFDQDASIEELSRTAAERLDAIGGIAARLRYRPTAEAALTADSAHEPYQVSSAPLSG